MDPTSTPHRPHIDPTSTLHRPHIDPHSTPISTQLRSKAISPTTTTTTTNTTFLFFSLHHHLLIFSVFFFFFLSDKLFRRSEGQSKAKMAKWGPNKGKKGQKKIKRAKTRTKETKKTIGPSFVIRSLQSMYLWEMLQTPRHTYTTETTVPFYGVSWSLAIQVKTTISTEHYITKAIVV